jgi:hypothetical protein
MDARIADDQKDLLLRVPDETRQKSMKIAPFRAPS